MAFVGGNLTAEEKLTTRLAEIEDQAWGSDIAGESRQPTKDELRILAEDLLAATAESVVGGGQGPTAGRLNAAIESVADRIGATSEAIEAAMGGSEGTSTAWDVLVAVLNAAVDPDWLNRVEGRGGQPLTAAEAGVDRHERVSDDNVIKPDGRSGPARATHWWSRNK